jgi:hypothetical protein
LLKSKVQTPDADASVQGGPEVLVTRPPGSDLWASAVRHRELTEHPPCMQEKPPLLGFLVVPEMLLGHMPETELLSLTVRI